MKRETFQRNMRLLAATWPERSPTADTAAAYWLALQDLCDCVFELAVRRAIRELTFYPRPAEIRARARRCGCQLLAEDGLGPPDDSDKERLRALGFEVCGEADSLPEPAELSRVGSGEGSE